MLKDFPLKLIIFWIGLSLLIIIMCWAVSSWLLGLAGLVLGTFLAGLLFFISYVGSEDFILKLHHARPLRFRESMGLATTVERIAQKARIQTPSIYLTADLIPNIFSVGRSRYRASLVISQGLLGVLNQQELEAVISHEIAHIANGDSLPSTMLAALLVRLYPKSIHDQNVSVWKLFFTSLMLFPLTQAIRFFNFRQQEFKADLFACELCENNDALANALRKIENRFFQSDSDNRFASSHLYIVENTRSNWVNKLDFFSCQPTVSERIEKILNRK